LEARLMQGFVRLSGDCVRPVVATGRVVLVTGDAVKVLGLLPSGCADSVVTDPPYGLGFDGQGWDGVSGFRESLGFDTAGMADGDVFEAWCRAWAVGALAALKPGGHLAAFGGTRTWHRLVRGVELAGFEVRDQIAWLHSTGMPKSLDVSNAVDRRLGAARADRRVETADSATVLGVTRRVVDKGEPVTEEARRAAGWGTGLRPGFEPVVIARKPLAGTVAENTLVYGTGGINIDAGRFGGGRWPVNAALDGAEAGVLDARVAGASRRFPVFRYEPKASRRERPKVDGVAHLTVKPLGLMRWLTRLLTPPGGVVLEPFAGSGSTVEAALEAGFRVIAVEKDPSFTPLIQARIERAACRG
jgi:site-specific DNA-methyltransferase (adenine-specific)